MGMNYNVLREGIADSIIRLFATKRIIVTTKQIYDAAKRDPEFKKQIGNYTKAEAEFQNELVTYCKDYPDDPICSKITTK